MVARSIKPTTLVRGLLDRLDRCADALEDNALYMRKMTKQIAAALEIKDRELRAYEEVSSLVEGSDGDWLDGEG